MYYSELATIGAMTDAQLEERYHEIWQGKDTLTQDEDEEQNAILIEMESRGLSCP